MEKEPKVGAASLRREIEKYIPRDDTGKRSMEIGVLAERSGASTRTVYRVLEPKRTKPVSLDLADRLLVAVDGPSVNELELVWEDG